MSKNEEKMMKISFLLNIITLVLVLLASISMYTGFKFMHGPDVSLETAGLDMFKFFTIDSNVFMGITALIFAIGEYKLLKGITNEIPSKIYLLKLMATASVGLTFFVVFAYLGPISEYGFASMLRNSNLFLHLIIPVLSMINFTIFERTNKIKLSKVWYGIIPTVAYSAFYLTNIIVHMDSGKVSPIYDWYWFVQMGVWTSIIVVPLIFGLTYSISLVLWKLNKKKEEN